MYQITHKHPRSFHPTTYLDNVPWTQIRVNECVTVPAGDLIGRSIKSARSDLYGEAIKHGYHIRTEVENGDINIWRKP